MPIRDDNIQQHSENVHDQTYLVIDSHDLTNTMSAPIHQQRGDSYATLGDVGRNGNGRHVQSTTYEEKTSIGVPITVSIPTVSSKTRRNMTKGEPRPMALLLGWIGAEKCQLDKYAQLYRALGYITVCATAPTNVLFSPFKDAIKRFTISVLRKVNAVPTSPSTPTSSNSDGSVDAGAGGGLVLHVFSNGGAFCLATIFEEDEEEYAKNRPSSNSLVEWVRMNSSAIIYDSAPCYTHREVAAKALSIGVASVLETADQRVMRVVEQGYLGLTGLFDRVLKYQQRESERFWTVMKNHRFWCDEIYVYSAADHMLDVEKLDDLIASRQEKKKDANSGYERFRVVKVKVDRARHVMILKRHTQVYIEAVGRAHESVNRWRVEHGLGRWDTVAIGRTTDSSSLTVLSKL